MAVKCCIDAAQEKIFASPLRALSEGFAGNYFVVARKHRTGKENLFIPREGKLIRWTAP
jgi:hypothetical protein